MRSPVRLRGGGRQRANAEFLPLRRHCTRNVTSTRVDPDYAINTDIEPVSSLTLRMAG
jgi:hypothetical protein